MSSIAASFARRKTGVALSLAIALGAAAWCHSAYAAPIASDSFNYTAGSNLVGQTGGSGWGSAWSEDAQGATAWTSTVGTTNGPPGATATNLPYSAFGGTGDSGGGATVSASSVVSTAAGTLYRTFATPISSTTANTLWGSVEFKGQATIKFQNFYQLIFSDTPNTGGAATTTTGLVDTLGTANGALHAIPLLAIGASPVNASNSGSAAPLYFADSDGGVGVPLNAAADDNQHMFIFQIMTGVTDPAHTSPALEVLTYADQSLANPSGWTAAATQFYDLSAAEQAGTITGVQYQGSNQATTTANRFLLMDEVKFGTTAQDVGAAASVSTPEPASLGLLAVGALTLMTRRRKA